MPSDGTITTEAVVATEPDSIAISAWGMTQIERIGLGPRASVLGIAVTQAASARRLPRKDQARTKAHNDGKG